MSVGDFSIFGGIAAAALVLASRAGRARAEPESPAQRWGWFIFLAGAGALTLAGLAALASQQPGDPWNAIRLTPAVGLFHGFKLYHPLTSGPVLSTVVGPVAFLFYAPVAWLPLGPTGLILAATTWNLVWFGTLVVWLLRPVRDRRLALAAGLSALNLALAYPSLRYSLFCAHADAPALLLGGTGLALVAHAGFGPRRMLAAALLFSLAVWAKQSLAPLLPVALLLAWWRHGRGAAMRAALIGIAVLAAVSAALIGWLGARELWDNMFRVPARHPWMQVDLATGQAYGSLAAEGVVMRAKVILAAALAIVRESWVLFAVLGGALVWQVAASRAARAQPPRWALFFVAALALFPTAILGRIKVGGEVNHFSFVVFFLVLAATLALAPADDDAPALALNRPWTPLRLAGAALVVLALVNAPRGLGYVGATAQRENQNEAAFRYEQAHPRRIYFPWNPLTPLLAHGALYHADYAVFDRNLGGALVTPEHLRQAMPSDRPIIASRIAHHDYILRRYFPDYVPLPADPELPEWKLYGPPSAAQPAAASRAAPSR